LFGIEKCVKKQETRILKIFIFTVELSKIPDDTFFLQRQNTFILNTNLFGGYKKVDFTGN
jgi:hypothetical protein